MAPAVKVQVKGLKHDATIKDAEKVLKDTKGWEKASDIAAGKLANLIDSNSKFIDGSEVMLSFSPMITWKYVMQGKVKNNFGRKGVFLMCTSFAT